MWMARAVTMAVVCNALAGCSSDGTADSSGSCKAAETDVEVDTGTGTLAGSLQTPETAATRGGCATAPLVIIFPGSGPVDRDGNSAPSLNTNTYAQLADALANHGVASVRYDKRGIGGSAKALPGDLASFTFDDELADAQAWVDEYNRAMPFDRVVLAGHSEGSLWALLLAQKSAVAGVISLEGAGRPIGTVLVEQLERQASAAGLTKNDLEQAKAAVASLEAGKKVSVAGFPPALAQIFAPVNQTYLINWMTYDPVAAAAEVPHPILVVQGTTDEQVTATDAELLAQANPDAQLLEIEGMSHMLKNASSSPGAQAKANTDPALPLNDELVSGVLSFIDGLPPL